MELQPSHKAGEEQQTKKTIKQYQWQNVWPLDHDTIYEKDDCWVFTEEMCKQRLKAYKDKGYEVADTSQNIIVSRDIAVPETKDLIKWMYLYHIKKGMIKLRDTRCYGCEIGLPGMQMEHMEYGCLAEWADVVHMYFRGVKRKISTKQVAKAVEKIMNELKIDINISEPDLLTMVLKASMKEYQLKQELTMETQVLINEKQDIRNDFYVLFSEICPNL